MWSSLLIVIGKIHYCSISNLHDNGNYVMFCKCDGMFCKSMIMIKLENPSADLKNKTLMFFSAGWSPRRHAIVTIHLLARVNSTIHDLIPQTTSVVIGANPLTFTTDLWFWVFLGFDAKMWLCNIGIKKIVILLYYETHSNKIRVPENRIK